MKKKTPVEQLFDRLANIDSLPYSEEERVNKMYDALEETKAVEKHHIVTMLSNQWKGLVQPHIAILWAEEFYEEKYGEV